MTDERPLGLHWGVKDTFLAYVARTFDGRMSVTDGAQATDGNVFTFENDPAGSDPEAGRFAFRGDLRFSAHAGMLFVRIAKPVISVVDGAAELSVLGAGDPDERVVLARCTLEPRPTDDDLRIWLATDVVLAQEAAPLFNDVYQPGEPLAPLAVFLPTS